MFSSGNNFQKIKKKFKSFDDEVDNPNKKKKKKNQYKFIRQEKRK